MVVEPRPITQPEHQHGDSSPCEVVGTAQLRWQVERALRSFSQVQAELIILLAEFDVSGEWAFDGADSCASWLADRHGIARSTARDWLRVSHELARCPTALAAFREGRLSYSAARAVTRITPQHPDRAKEIIDLSIRTAINDLPRTLAGWVQDNETSDQQEERHERETRLSVRVEADGMSVMTLVLPPQLMAEILAVVDGQVRSGAGFNGLTGAARRRSLAGQRARCLHQILTTGSTTTVEREIVLHVRPDGCSMQDGTPVSSHAVASLIDDSFISALIHDIDGKPIDATHRRRLPTRRQRRVVDERHGTRCVDCGSSDLLEYDHNPPFALTHRTVVDELEVRCASCHRKRHRATEGDTA
ncbi:MAG: DUF222 domain-containing protein [Actinobacteria bacterium]|nr:DUF222 domain-containing protein [Actinomycetota bacterium]